MSQLALVCPLILQIKRKEKEKNNNLADLPSHDIDAYFSLASSPLLFKSEKVVVSQVAVAAE